MQHQQKGIEAHRQDTERGKRSRREVLKVRRHQVIGPGSNRSGSDVPIISRNAR